MRIERLRISSRFLEKLGFSNFFEKVTFIEIMNTFQYDKNNFLSLEKIIFKPGLIDRWESILRDQFPVEFVQLVTKMDNTITCIVKSTSKSGFFPLPSMQMGSWAIIPPISMDSRSIILTLIADEDTLPRIHEEISRLDERFSVLALNDLGKTMQGGNVFLPDFTERQREIATFAVRRGYFQSPKRISAGEIARNFDISVSAVNEHLRKVKRLAMEYFFS